MHNLIAKFESFIELSKSVFKQKLDPFQNLKFYPNKPKVSDIQVIALSMASEAASIDSENALFCLLEAEHPELFARLPHRTNFNRRRRALREFIDELAMHLADELTADSSRYLIDSMPIPVCRFARFPRLRIMKSDMNFTPHKGYLPIDKVYFGGYKLHVVTCDRGVVVNYTLTQASAHDVTQLTDLTSLLPDGSELIGDKGYISQPKQLSLFETRRIRVVTPSRRNQRQQNKAWKPAVAKARKRIETLFSQLCDFMNIKRNYAKDVEGLLARITTKIAAVTALQFLNQLSGLPLNHVKNSRCI